MRILPSTCNYFSPPATTKQDAKNKPSFAKLRGEDVFIKELGKSKDFNESQKSLAEKIVDLTKDALNKSEYDKVSSRFILFKADPKDEDPRANVDRIMFSVSDEHDMLDGVFIDPCIRFDSTDGSVDDYDISELANDMINWHNEVALRAKPLDSEDCDGPPPPYDNGDPFGGWVDPFPM